MQMLLQLSLVWHQLRVIKYSDFATTCYPQKEFQEPFSHFNK